MTPSRHSSIHTLFLVAVALTYQLPLTQAQLRTTATTTPPPSNFTTLPPKDDDIRGGSPSPALSYYGVFQNFGVLCGASLIWGDIALTAAHCVKTDFPGALRFNSQQRTSGGTLVNVVSRTLHPGWTGSVSSTDLAILKLQDFLSLEPVIVNSNAAVPSQAGELMSVAGFGLTESDSGISNTLLATTIPYVVDCSKELESFQNLRHICGDSVATATCGGDSGSPVLLDGTTTQIGINSYSNGDCNDQTLDVYTRVSWYSGWIQNEICLQSSNPPASCTPPDTPAPTPSPTTGIPTPQAPTTPPAPTTKSPTPAPVPVPSPTCALTKNVGVRGIIANMFSYFRGN